MDTVTVESVLAEMAAYQIKDILEAKDNIDLKDEDKWENDKGVEMTFGDLRKKMNDLEPNYFASKKVQVLGEFDKKKIEDLLKPLGIQTDDNERDAEVVGQFKGVNLTVADLKDRLKQVIKEDEIKNDFILQEYSNSGFDKNIFGHYFNPNTDEYDPNYDPHKDDLLVITAIRKEMGKILKKAPYAGIENEYIFNVSYQLDDWEVDKFQDLKSQLDKIKWRRPDLFKDVMAKDDKKDDSKDKKDEPKGDEGKGDDGKGDEGKGDEGKGDEGKGDEGKGDEGKGDEGKGDEGKGDEGKDKPTMTPEEAKKAKRKQILKKIGKGVVFAAGFATGFGLSTVPGVGTIRMVAAASKMSIALINTITDKRPNWKISKAINAKKENFKEKHPKIYGGIHKIKEKAKSSPINTAVNGLATGYIVGNIWELIKSSGPFGLHHDMNNTLTYANGVQSMTGAPVPMDAQNALLALSQNGETYTFFDSVVNDAGETLWKLGDASGKYIGAFPKEEILEKAGQFISSGMGR